MPILPALGGAQVLRGLAYGSYTANAMTFTTESAAHDRRGSVSGVFAAVSSAGQLAGTLAGGFIVQAVGFGPLFALGALGAAAAAVCFWRLKRTHHRGTEEAQRNTKREVSG